VRLVVERLSVRRGATLEDLKRACEAVGLVAIERAEVGSGESWRIAADALQAERDILSGQNATLRAQLAAAEDWKQNYDDAAARNVRMLNELREARNELAELKDSATPAEGRATDEELRIIYAKAETAAEGVAAVAERVRRERGECLVERLVASETSFYVTDEGLGTEVQWQVTVRPNGKMQHSRSDVPAADVPATLARLAGLGEK
jgi:hypothetical protein